ncbi:MAG: hypothetical protein EOO20_04800 [Chryseobacterium sp.]|uniref:hypothetical protein n=1 Tax=Pedobacter agri TaxID=454586 RepID=UPI001212D703|nr:hypothetical protein [Pedobacter agri]RZJ91507.1 MAG: hypothetical protein EOO20_04800 [Chryseobacterium sp.]
MIYIDQTSSEFQYAIEEHYKNLRYIIKKKLLGKQFTEAHPKGLLKRVDKITGIHSSVAKFLNDEENLKNVLIGNPEILDGLKLYFTSKKTIQSIKSLIRYDGFVRKKTEDTFGFYNGYHLAENLGIQTCVYCNRLYTNTIITEKKEFISRPTFDHWYPKGQFPLLALSFYNLIPSCSVCNSGIKGATEYSLDQIFHPYFKNPSPERALNLRFSYDLENHEQAATKIVSYNSFTDKTLKVMKLAEMYSCHSDIIRELIYLKKAYSDTYLHTLQDLLQIDISPEEVYRLAFGVYLEDDHHVKRPLSKLKKDILVELGILK